MNSKEVRVRIAPSPSGYLHVGTARMAIANFLFARHAKGKFLIRIEDTDADRSDNKHTEYILSGLKWLGIEPDEEIIYQSQRTDLYKKYAQQILESGYGYRCFCTPEQLGSDREEARKNKSSMIYNRRCFNLTDDEIQNKLDNDEKFAIRIKIPDGESTFDDMIGGKLTRQNEDIEDFIIARSDGTATYNMAVVIDDNDMKISHVIRGNDHITNTFKQLHIYKSLRFELPQFGHLPLILRPDKKKISKRLGDKGVVEYKQEGILPEAMFNFLSLLGWSPKNDQEIFNVNELIENFEPSYFNKSNAVFNEEKLLSFNKEHINLKSDHELAVEIAPLLVDAGYTTKYWLETRWEYLRSIVGLLKERVKRLSDFVSMSNYFFTDKFEYDTDAEKKQFNKESAEFLELLADNFDSLEKFDHDSIAKTLTEIAEEKEIKKAALIHPTRLAVSGVPGGPGLYDLLEVLSQRVVVDRMRKAVNYIRTK
jgi:glutamyl-tRNA synthetase